MPSLQSHEVARLVVGSSLDPATIEDTDPLEGECAQGGLVAHAASSTSLIERLRPKGTRHGLTDPLDEGLAQEGRTGEAPMDPGFVAAPLRDRSDAGVFLEGSGVGEALAPLAEGDEQSRRQGGPGSGESAKEFVIGQLRAKAGYLGVETSYGGACSAELRKERVYEQAHRRDDGCVGRERAEIGRS